MKMYELKEWNDNIHSDICNYISNMDVSTFFISITAILILFFLYIYINHKDEDVDYNY